ncbi:MAG: alanine dehydrogenase [Gammaproteobacteria bacterium]|nr:alanine dehydrogenase [Gammaproteobacteria bacterium]
MDISVVKEIKDREQRVALTPDGAHKLIQAGHCICVEHNAGAGSGFTDEQYLAAGASIVDTNIAWSTNLVLKVKEPLASEYSYLNGQILFTFLHLSGVEALLTKALLKHKVTAIAYETIEDKNGRFPLLAPMSAIAGNMAALIGAYYLAKHHQGNGTQLGRVLGKRNGKVMVVGDGVVGMHSAITAAGMGAKVFLCARRRTKYTNLPLPLRVGIGYLKLNPVNLAEYLPDMDLLIGAVLAPGARAPRLITESMVKQMQPGAVIVDVSIDQGGCVETSRPTSHSDPIFIKHNVIHYCVTNMPGAYPRTSTIALTNATLPYILRLANKGVRVLRHDPHFARGVNTCNGFITCQPVAVALQLESQYKPLIEITLN